MKDRVEQALIKAQNDFDRLTEEIGDLQGDIVEANKLLKEGAELKDAALQAIKMLDEKRAKVSGVIEFLKGWEE